MKDQQQLLDMPDLQAEADTKKKERAAIAQEMDGATCSKCNEPLDLDGEECGLCDVATCKKCMDENDGEAHHDQKIHADLTALHEKKEEEQAERDEAFGLSPSRATILAAGFRRLRLMSLGMARRVELLHGQGDNSNYLYELAESLLQTEEEYVEGKPVFPHIVLAVYRAAIDMFRSEHGIPYAGFDFSDTLRDALIQVAHVVLVESEEEPEAIPFSKYRVADVVCYHFAESLVVRRGLLSDQMRDILNTWAQRLPPKGKKQSERVAREFEIIANRLAHSLDFENREVNRRLRPFPSHTDQQMKEIKEHEAKNIPSHLAFTAIEYLAFVFMGKLGAPPRKVKDVRRLFETAAQETVQCTATWSEPKEYEPHERTGEPTAKWTLLLYEVKDRLTKHLRNEGVIDGYRTTAFDYICELQPTERAYRAVDVLLHYLEGAVAHDPTLASHTLLDGPKHERIRHLKQDLIQFLEREPYDTEACAIGWRQHKAHHPSKGETNDKGVSGHD